MESGDMLVVSAQGVLTVGIAIIGYFMRRLIDRSDKLEDDLQAMETQMNKNINKIRERAIRLETHGQNYEEKMLEVKTRLDTISADIVWIREKLASRQ